MTLQTVPSNELSAFLDKMERCGFSEKLNPYDVRLLLKHLGIEKNFFLITVTGTNGKGSTSHLLERILLNSGYRVGLFTSPHLFCYNERIRINGKTQTDDDLALALKKADDVLKSLNLTAGYFLYTFLAGLILFNKAHLDFLILEVGCGGRLDPSNAFDADLVAITSIGLDHQALLGNTKEAIALEKSALARENKPVVIGDLNFPKEAFNFLVEKKALIELIGQSDHLSLLDQWQDVMPLFLHQNNVAVVLKIVEILKSKDYQITEEAIKISLLNFQLTGRCQAVCIQGRTVIFDVGHNEDSFRHLALWLKKQYPKQTYHALFSALATKSVDEILNVSGDVFNTWTLTSLEAFDDRAMPKNSLEMYFKGKKYHFIDNPIDAFDMALQALDKDQVLIVCGSFILVSALLSYCNKKGDIE